MNRIRIRELALLAICLLSIGSPGCMSAYRRSVGATVEQAYIKIFVTDPNTAWQAILEALKSYRLDVSDRESGFIQTRWKDNTSERNLVDSFGSADIYLKAQFRFRINMDRGRFAGTDSIKITVQREQVVQRDVLEGWRPVDTDGIEERTLLYRLERLIAIRDRIATIERERIEQQIKDAPKFD